MQTIITSQFSLFFLFAKNFSYNLFSNIIWTIIYNVHLQPSIGLHSNQHQGNPVPMSGAWGTSESLRDADGLRVFSPQLSTSLPSGCQALDTGLRAGNSTLDDKAAWPLRNNCAVKSDWLSTSQNLHRVAGAEQTGLGEITKCVSRAVATVYLRDSTNRRARKTPSRANILLKLILKF